MSPKNLRLVGLLFVVASLVLAILNLRRVANAGTFWVSTPLLLFGVILIARSRRG